MTQSGVHAFREDEHAGEVAMVSDFVNLPAVSIDSVLEFWYSRLGWEE